MARVPTQFRHTCEICHEVFYSEKSRALYDKPACKQVAYRARRKQAIENKKWQLDMATFQLFEQVCINTPEIRDLLIAFLKEHDQKTFRLVLEMISVTQTSETAGQRVGG